MQAYFIDAAARTVNQIETAGGLAEMYRLIGCELVQAVKIGNEGDALYVDEEGLLKPQAHLFHLMGHNIAGNGLIVGTDDEGNDVDARMNLDTIRNAIQWATPDELGYDASKPLADQIDGPMAAVISFNEVDNEIMALLAIAVRNRLAS